VPVGELAAPEERAALEATSPPGVDAYAPAQMAARVERVGVDKAALDALSTLSLAVLAGAFIAMGAQFSVVVVTQSALGFGATRLLGGLAFSLGLVLVVVGGAELFTGNNLITMAWASGRVSMAGLLRNWALVYAGNLVGAVATAALVFGAGVWRLGDGAVGATLVALATAKTSLGFLKALLRGVLCNALVCLAIWLCFSARSTTDNILSILLPISAFVACGYEHSVANMFLLPLERLVHDAVAPGTAEPGWDTIMWRNLVPVTIGNVIGGAGMVGAVYWLVYLRPGRQPAGRDSR